MAFNKKLSILRDKKASLIDNINKDVDKLDQINNILTLKTEKKFQKIALRPEEQPEK